MNPETEPDFYNELSKLNNDLANSQRELFKKNIELERFSQEKTRFLGMAAHDLRTPIGIIMSYSQFLIEEASATLSREHMEFVVTIHESSQFMLALIDDLLDISAIESGHLSLDMQPGNLTEVVERNVSLNRVLAQKRRITILLEHDEAPLTCVFDGAKIGQVLNNLISNAIKYSPQRTTILVRLFRCEDEAVIEIKDQGPGIPPLEQAKLFKAFSQTNATNFSGEHSTGLGLAISKRIVEGHAGRVWVESELGVGSSFFAAIPISR